MSCPQVKEFWTRQTELHPVLHCGVSLNLSLQLCQTGLLFFLPCLFQTFSIKMEGMQYERNTQTTRIPTPKTQKAANQPLFSFCLQKNILLFSCLAFVIFWLCAFSSLPKILSACFFKLIQANDTMLTFITLFKLYLTRKLEFIRDLKFQLNIDAAVPWSFRLC